MDKTHTTNLFWTGGWDSTFRLLDLVLEKKKFVQPFYLIDSKRSSAAIELETMDKIKDQLLHRYPHTQDLILPTIIMNSRDIKKDRSIELAYQNLIRKFPLGSQYPWLSKFCKEKSIDEMELCLVSKKGKGTVFHIKPYVDEFKNKSEKYFKIKAEFYDTPEGIIFRYYRFPTLHLSKQQLHELVKQKGWSDIMEMTWFCHKPLFGNIPCGICTPCTDAFHENLSWRFPFYLVFLDKIKVLTILRYIRKKIIKFMHY